jgi:hypothetical protein
MVVNDDEGYLNARVVLAFFASMLAPTGPAAMGHPWPSAAKPASMPVYPLRRTGTKPLDVARKSKARSRSNAKARRPDSDLIAGLTTLPCGVVVRAKP